MSSLRPPRRAADQTRRLRDLLRTEIVASTWADRALPSEEELRATFDAPRAVVREALDLLQAEGLVTRVRGQGTFVTREQIESDLHEMHGVDEASPDSIWSGRMSTRILDWGDVAAPPPIARTLAVEVGETVLRIDYAALLDGSVLWCTTNYLVYPEASTLSPEMLRVDFYAMLRQGGISIGQSRFRIDSSIADRFDVEILGAALGEPVLVVEQLIDNEVGRPIDVAYARGNAHGPVWVSRAARSSAEPGEP